MITRRSILMVTSEITYLPAIQAFAREFAREIGFNGNDQEMILLALEKAVTNVIDHAFESAEQSFQIMFEPSARGYRDHCQRQRLALRPPPCTGICSTRQH